MSNKYLRLNRKKQFLKALIVLLELVVIAIIVYFVALPLFPIAKYKLAYQSQAIQINWQDIDIVKQKISQMRQALSLTNEAEPNQQNVLPQAEYDVSPNRVIIAKIGVNAPIVESANASDGLSKGAWHLPDSSTPDQGGNTIITGHRFKYLPPSNLTFYLFHELEIGDIVLIIWQGQEYYYKIKQIKIVEATDFSILAQTEEPMITLFTCDPIYSQKNRLVVIAELITQ